VVSHPASVHGHHAPALSIPSIQRTEVWVSSGWFEEIYWPFRESNHDFLVAQPLASSLHRRFLTTLYTRHSSTFVQTSDSFYTFRICHTLNAFNDSPEYQPAIRHTNTRSAYSIIRSTYIRPGRSHRLPSVFAIYYACLPPGPSQKVHVVLKRQRSPTIDDIVYRVPYVIMFRRGPQRQILRNQALVWNISGISSNNHRHPPPPGSRTISRQTFHMSSSDG
jgi:hypothetical protein